MDTLIFYYTIKFYDFVGPFIFNLILIFDIFILIVFLIIILGGYYNEHFK